MCCRAYTEFASCTPHSISGEGIEKAVLDNLQTVIKLVKIDEKRFVQKMTDASLREDARSTQMGNREQVIADCKLMLEMLSEHSKLDVQIEKSNDEVALIASLVSACVHENAEKAQGQDAFNKQYTILVNRHQKALARLEKLKAACADKVTRQKVLRNYIDTLMTAPLVLGASDEQLWRLLVVKGIVGRDGRIGFEFRGEDRIYFAR